MVEWATAALSGVGVLVVLGVLYLVWSRWLSGPDHQQEATEETQERLQMADDSVSNADRVGLFQRTRAQPTTTKAFYLSLLALFVVLAYAAYTLFQSGTPEEMAYNKQLHQLVFGTVIAVGVVWFVRRQDRKAGELRVTLENDATSVKEIPFDWDMADPAVAANEGKDVVLAPAFKKRRLLGLFWRVALAADDPQTRDLDKAQPEDRALYEVPMDDSAAWDYRNQTVTVRAKDIEACEDPNRVATHTFVPSDRASKGELDDKKQVIAELEQEVEHLEEMDAIKDERIADLQEHLKNREHDSEQEYEKAMQNVLSLLNAITGGQQGVTDGDGNPSAQLSALQQGTDSSSTNGEKADAN
ncbi:hypothetical protein [Haloarcula sp. JP-L23]|uniref:hypothetical protein n=1 Tax=Haloarcula sp. JP-L23 TaxID=2716717 RepID=UPI00140F390C|nr:hypothetical protein G9465_24545 [Haloarcula sp. JP-L23]